MMENQFSRPGQILLEVLFAMVFPVLLIEAIRSAAVTGAVPHPWAFLIPLSGFVSFVVPKLMVIRRQNWINWGTKWMTEDQANAYRIGYWLMIVGVVLTFVPWSV